MTLEKGIRTSAYLAVAAFLIFVGASTGNHTPDVAAGVLIFVAVLTWRT